MVDRPRTSRKVLTSACALALVAACSGRAVATGAAGPAASPLGHAIVFTRFLPGADMGEVYRIDAGGTTLQPIHSVFDAAILSPDATRFLDFAPAADSGTTGIFNVDGSGYRTLPPDPNLILPGGQWTSGGARIATEGLDPNDPAAVGIYSRRSSDGGGLLRLTDAGSRRDYPAKASPDGSRLLFFRPDAPNETSDSAAQDLFVVGSRGGGLMRLTPPGYTTGIPFSYGSIGWSPDGTRVVVVAAKGQFWNATKRSAYTERADGSRFTRVGPRGDIWEAVWSPDGRWIALTMATNATGGLHELYVMHPNGSGLRQLTTATDGLYARNPIWSPDSEQLLITRGGDDPHVGDLWSIDLDGSDLYSITDGEGEIRAPAWLP